MAITKVEAPDGSIIRVEHPADASQEQILAYAEQEFRNRRFAASLPDPGADRAEVPVQDGGSIADALGQGALFGFSDELAGLTGATIGTFDSDLGGTSFAERYKGIRDAARANAEAFASRNPGTSLAANIVGGVATGGVGAAKAGAFAAAKNAPNLAGKLRPIVQTGAVQGGLFGAGASEGDARGVAQDTLKGAAIGAATAPILPLLAGGARNAANRVLNTQTGNKQYNTYSKLLEKEAGIDTLTTGQKTGSPQIRSAESTMSETVFGARVGKQLEENRRKLQSKLMEMAGFARKDASDGLVTADSVERAGRRFTKRYEKLLKNENIDLTDDTFIDDLARVEYDHLQLIPPFQRKQISQIVDSLLDEATSGPISAERYQKIRSRLSTLSSTGTDPNIKSLYRSLKNALDDAFARQGSKGASRKAIDKEYSRYAKIRDAFEGSGSIDTSRGYLNLSSLLRKATRFGDKDFNDMLRAGQAVLGDPVPNSATASRVANMLFLGQGAGSALVGGADAGLISLGLPLGFNQFLSRGFTGSPTADKLIASGLLTAPAVSPIFGPGK